MSEKYYITPSSGIKIKWGGPTDLKELYRQMKLWLENNGFAKEDSLEKRYIEMIKPAGKDLFILWECGKGASDYFSYKIKIEFRFIALSEVEMQEGNYKVKMMKGTLEIAIISYVEYGFNWDQLGFLNRMYQKYVAKSRLKDHADSLYGKVYKFQKMIKDFIGLEA